MSVFLSLLIKVLAFLPDSFILKAISDHRTDIQPFVHIMSYINYFIPFQVLLNIFSGWAAAMILTVVIFRIINKL